MQGKTKRECVENMICREGDGEKVTVEKEGGTTGQERREPTCDGVTMRGRKKVIVDVSKWKPITRMMTRGRKERNNRKQRQGKSQRLGRCKTEELL